MPEAKALKRRLAQRGIQAFLCDVPPGEDIARAVIHALHNCELAVILGTATYGTETKSSFSTFQELRYIFDRKIPYFLVKMCREFRDPEALFRLSSNISYYPWQPTGVERQCVPQALVDQIAQRLASVQRGGVASPASRGVATMSVPAASQRSGVDKYRSHAPSVASAAAAATSDTTSPASLVKWLESLSLSNFQPALQAAGAETLHDVQFAMSQGLLSADDFVAHGLTKIPIARFLHEAAKVGGRGREG